MAHSYDPSTWEVEPGLSALGQSWLHCEFEANLGYINKTLSLKNNNNNKNKKIKEREIKLQSLELSLRIINY